MNAPIARLFVRRRAAVRACSSVATSWWTVFERRRPARQPARTAARCSRSSRSAAARSAPPTARCSPAVAQAARRDATRAAIRPGRLFAHAVGYSLHALRAAPASSSCYDDDADRAQRASSARSSTTCSGAEQRGRRPAHDARPGRAARRARSGSAGRKGAVVALDPRTGAVKVMASVPGYDPNDAAKTGGSSARCNRDPDAPLLNRATQAGYPPGSTFKVVTAIAGARQRAATRRTRRVSGEQRQDDLRRAAAATSAARTSATIDLTDALTQSVNTVWAQVGEKLGKATMAKYMDRFGFDAQAAARPTRRRACAPAASTPSGKLHPADERRASTSGAWPSARTSCTVTPLQMAMVAARSPTAAC